MDSGSHLDPRAEQLFLSFLSRRDAGEVVDFDAHCAAEPRLADSLRALHAAYEIVERLRPAQDSEPLAQKLRRQYGDAADLSLSLDGRAEPAPPVSGPREPSGQGADSDLLRRLEGSGPRGTRYKLLGEVARGGMGAVLRIWDDELRRTLAMKVVLGKGEASTDATPEVDPKTLGRFLEEAQITGQLDHPGIVPVHELGLDSGGRVYFTMKLVKGETLRTVFEHVKAGRDGWSQVRALNVLLRVCEALAFAHSKGVVHRDLKPANVMVGKFGEVYVMDWGLARVLGREDKHDLRIRVPGASTPSVVRTERHAGRGETPDSPLVTMDGDVVGTPSFMPPEQARGDLERLGAHSDVYSLGAMLYQLVTGEVPYVPAGARVSQHTILAAVLRGPPEPVESLAPRTPPELVAICEKAMAREIGQRYPDTMSLASDLRAYLEGRVVAAYETGTWAETRKWVQRNKPLAASLAAAVLAIVAGVVAFAVKAEEATALAALESASKNEALAATERANELRDAAIARTDAVWAIQELAEFKKNASEWEFLWSLDRPQCEWWLENARGLVYGREADEARGVKRKPSLADHQRLLATIREDALPYTDEDRLTDETTHPLLPRLESKQTELLWLSRMLGLAPAPTDAEADALVEALKCDSSQRTSSTSNDWEPLSLAEAALNLAGPGLHVTGEETRALGFARHAVSFLVDQMRAAAAQNPIDASPEAPPRSTEADERPDPEGELATATHALTWALYYCGRAQEGVGLSPEGPKRPTEADREGWARRRSRVASEVDTLREQVASGRTYRFDDGENRWWNRHLTKLESDLLELRGRIGLVEQAVTSDDGARRWNEAIAAIAEHPRYGGIVLEPQVDLLPIGPDPQSTLWEFAHLPTGSPARRAADGRLVLEPDAGLVFVLLPGGRLPVEDGQRPGAIHGIDLDPFFLSKYEMTKEQWSRIAGSWTGMHNYRGQKVPADSVSWDDAQHFLGEALGWLRLPSGAQWEYGCRAGTTTAWWTGKDEASLLGAENLDHFQGPLVVGSLGANPFGLHDVLGNLLEWCQDASFLGTYRGRDALTREPGGPTARTIRGGGFGSGASSSLTSGWVGLTSEIRSNNIGLRPSRALRLASSPLHPSPK